MNNDKKLGRLRALIHDYDCYIFFYSNFQYKSDFNLIEHLDQKISQKFDVKKNWKNSYMEIKQLVLDLNITKEEYFQISYEESQKINLHRESLKNKDPKESRDNKGVYVGSGNSNANKIRYPKKARSKKVWAIFYKMFPGCAKVDGWDGETSKRMN